MYRQEGVPVMYRQGDVRLVLVAEAPEGRRLSAENGRLVLARGEATGHHHSVACQGAELIDAGAHGVFLRIMEATDLVHQEHGAITVPPGDYQVLGQRQHTREAPRQVAD